VVVSHCPSCAAPLPAWFDRCGGCGVSLAGPVAHRIGEIDAELGRFSQRAHALLAERSRLVTELRAERAQSTFRPVALVAAGAGWSAGAGAGPYAGPPAPPPPPPPAPPGPPPGWPPVAEASPVSVQNVLLGLGALLLGVAAVAFTVVAWGRVGIGGKAGILAVLTVAALAAPAALVRRGLRASAEAMWSVALVLAVLDGYAAWRLDLAGLHAVDGRVYAAVLTALLAAGCAGYRALVPLRLPRLAALLLLQLPLPLAAAAADAPTVDLVMLALLGTATLDALVSAIGRHRHAGAGRRAGRLALALGAGAWLIAMLDEALDGLWYAAMENEPPVRAAALLGLGAAIAIGFAATYPAGPGRAVPAAAGSLAAATALIALLLAPLGPWAAVAPAAVGVLAVAVRLALPDGWRRGPLAAGGFLLAAGAAMPAVGAVIAATAPLSWAGAAWTGTAGRARELVSADPLGWLPPAAVVPAAALVTLGLALGAAGRVGFARALARPAAAIGGTVTVLLVPVALDLPYPAALAVLAAAGTGLVAAGVLALDRALVRLTGVAGAGLGAVALAWSLAVQPATLAVLGLVTAVAAAAAAAPDRRAGTAPAGTGTAPGAAPRAIGAGRRVVGTAVAVAAAAGEAAAVCLAAGAPARWVAFGPLGVAVAAAAGAALLARRRPAESLTLEVAAIPLAGAGLVLAAAGGVTASLAFGVVGAALAGAALRPGRRWLAPAAAAAMLVAGWIALGTIGVHLVEAYTLPPAAAALAFGLLRRRAGRVESSWLAYGPGLAAALAPSMAVAWTETDWRRPLLFGLAGLGVLLAGAWRRLQAPVALGAGTVVLVALHELGPDVLRLAGTLPRWVPLAVAGALLVGLGISYERRLGDLHRARAAFGRLG
jgi:hypothetical protein